MAKFKLTGSGARFHCPGCDRAHVLNFTEPGKDKWDWNGSLDKPTVHPSYWVTHNSPINLNNLELMKEDIRKKNEHGTPIPYAKQSICHSFITDGEIRFLEDCVHDLAGKTVILPEVD